MSLLLLLLVVVGIRWSRDEVAGRRFLLFGSNFTVKSEHPWPESIYGGAGYDGQFFARLAIAPFSNKPAESGMYFDDGLYRQQRILYPLLAFAGSMGTRSYVPTALIVVNLLAASMTLWLLLPRNVNEWIRHPALWLLPGLLQSMSRDLAEPTTIFFLCASVLAFERRFDLLGASLLSLAILARETSLVWCLVGIAAFLFQGSYRRAALTAFAPLPAFAWHLFLTTRWQLEDGLRGSGNFAIPLAGIWDACWHVSKLSRGSFLLWILLVSWQAMTLILPIIDRQKLQAKCDDLGRWLAWMTWVGLILPIFFSASIWGDRASYLRVLLECQLAGVMLMTLNERLPPRWMSLASLVVIALISFLVAARH